MAVTPMCRDDSSVRGNHNGKTRPRPSSSSHSTPTITTTTNTESIPMEAIHAELLDNYHRESLHFTSQELHNNSNNNDGTTREEDDDSSPEIELKSSSFGLSETPNSVMDVFMTSSSPHLLQPGTRTQKAAPATLSRTESVDRRLNEAVRFYQAVGESPPTSQSDIQRIIEDDHNSDSDSEEETAAPITEPSTVESAITFDVSFKFKQMGAYVSSSVAPSIQKFFSIFYKLPTDFEIHSEGFQYKGISNPPEITKRGLSRGNYALLHRKAWLEVSDERHRYGKNLRLYYRKWESLGHPTNDFFDWLDSKRASAGNPLPDLTECPRAELDSDTVLYIKDSEVTKQYALSLVCDKKGTARVLDAHHVPVCTGPDGWIFVLRDDVLYGAEKVTSVSEQHSRQRFHHSSFFGGKAVAAAGIFITNSSGCLIRVLPHSGHYRPGEADMQRMLFYLFNQGVDLRLIEVDTQQLNHINRKDPNSVKKKAKKDSMHLCTADVVAHFLSHKARCIGLGIFRKIHCLENMDRLVVADALRIMDVEAE